LAGYREKGLPYFAVVRALLDRCRTVGDPQVGLAVPRLLDAQELARDRLNLILVELMIGTAHRRYSTI